MDEQCRQQICALGRTAHELTENAYRTHGAVRGDPAWADRQRILLADMALHLLQTALHDGELPTDSLRQNLYAILTISEQFVPGADLKSAAERLRQG